MTSHLENRTCYELDITKLEKFFIAFLLLSYVLRVAIFIHIHKPAHYPPYLDKS